MTEAMPRWLERIGLRLLGLPRNQKRLVMFLADTVFVPLALWTAISLKLGSADHGSASSVLLYLCALASSTPIFVRLGLYRAILRFIGHRAMIAVFAGVTSSVVLLCVANASIARSPVPMAAFAIYWALALIYVGGSRLLWRSLLHYHHRSMGAQRVAIYGAGTAGAQLASALAFSDRFHPVVFLDDSPSLQRGLVNGIEVYSPDALPELIREEGISTVLLALPSQSRRRRQEILKQLEKRSVRVQTMPDITRILSGQATVEDIQDVDASDLLGRDPVPPNESLLDACIRSKVVMVSGAGGSIGSELCRQILRLGPSKLLLFEISELALYNIERELAVLADKEQLQVDLVGLLGNAHHRSRVKEVISAYGVQTIYHAAAYKHVPIVEHNIVEGIYNNVYSTWHVAEAAAECKVETFVLISTDKAVNPTNVMGATKRFAEIVLQGLQDRGASTKFCMVRFGNVLESSGSVVPLFREQIKRGGPVTVTHKDVIRYFMTIPEAAQLVLQAGSMASGGDVFVLDMGKPVRIEDLARRMINLMGLSVREEANPDGDIEIIYTGLRAAEKLFEELLIGNNVTGTGHSMIMRAIEHSLPWATVQQVLDEMLVALNKFDCKRARELLMQTVAEYKPSGDIHDLVWSRKSALTVADHSNVTALLPRRPRPPPAHP